MRARVHVCLLHTFMSCMFASFVCMRSTMCRSNWRCCEPTTLAPVLRPHCDQSVWAAPRARLARVNAGYVHVTNVAWTLSFTVALVLVPALCNATTRTFTMSCMLQATPGSVLPMTNASTSIAQRGASLVCPRARTGLEIHTWSVPPRDNRNFVSVSKGCGLKADGKAVCGHVGPSSAAPPDRAFVEISSTHTGFAGCGITVDRAELLCWGHSSLHTGHGLVPAPGKLLLGVATLDVRQPEAFVGGCVAVVDVATAATEGARKAALRRGGRPHCWGNFHAFTPSTADFVSFCGGGARHQPFICGLRSGGSVECQGPRPPDASTLHIVSGSLACMEHAVCGLDVEGKLQCRWTQLSTVPHAALVRGPRHLRFTQLATMPMWATACGVDTSNTVHCWGDYDFGQSELPLPGDMRFVSVAAGTTHTCGISQAGAVLCWGDSAVVAAHFDELGRALPDTALAGDRWQSVSAGRDFSCVISHAGTVECFGANSYMEDTVPPPGAWHVVGSGSSHACAVLAEDGSVACWGHNPDGRATPPPLTGITHVALGSYHTCAMRLHGSITCFGNDAGGRVAGTAHGGAAVDGVVFTHSIAGGFSSVCAATEYTCAVAAVDGALVCWGDATAVLPPVAATWSAITCHDEHLCGFHRNDATGEVHCHGYNYGRVTRLVDRTAPTMGFATVSAGRYHTCGLTRDSRVVCLGPNPTVLAQQVVQGTPIARLDDSFLYAVAADGSDLGMAVNYFVGRRVGVFGRVKQLTSYCAIMVSGRATCLPWPVPDGKGSRYTLVDATMDHNGIRIWCGVTDTGATLCSGNSGEFPSWLDDHAANPVAYFQLSRQLATALTQYGTITPAMSMIDPVATLVGVCAAGDGKCAWSQSGGVWCYRTRGRPQFALPEGSGVSSVACGSAPSYVCMIDRAGSLQCDLGGQSLPALLLPDPGWPSNLTGATLYAGQWSRAGGQLHAVTRTGQWLVPSFAPASVHTVAPVEILGQHLVVQVGGGGQYNDSHCLVFLECASLLQAVHVHRLSAFTTFVLVDTAPQLLSEPLLLATAGISIVPLVPGTRAPCLCQQHSTAEACVRIAADGVTLQGLHFAASSASTNISAVVVQPGVSGTYIVNCTFSHFGCGNTTSQSSRSAAWPCAAGPLQWGWSSPPGVSEAAPQHHPGFATRPPPLDAVILASAGAVFRLSNVLFHGIRAAAAVVASSFDVVSAVGVHVYKQLGCGLLALPNAADVDVRDVSASHVLCAMFISGDAGATDGTSYAVLDVRTARSVTVAGVLVAHVLSTPSWTGAANPDKPSCSGSAVRVTHTRKAQVRDVVADHVVTVGHGGLVCATFVEEVLIGNVSCDNVSTTGHGGVVFVSHGTRADVQGVWVHGAASGLGGGAVALHDVPVVDARNITASHCHSHTDGGAVSIARAAAVVLAHVAANDTHAATGSGGAVHVAVNDHATVVVSDVATANTSAAIDGGSLAFMASAASAVVLRDITVHGGVAQHGAGGGVFATWTAGSLDVQLDNSLVEHCMSLVSGGGVAVMPSSPTTLVMAAAIAMRDIVVSNCSSAAGGGIAAWFVSLVATRAAFVHNTADTGGGAVYCQLCDVNLTATDASHNVAGGKPQGATSLPSTAVGGAVAVVSCLSSGVALRGCTVSYNLAREGGALYVRLCSSLAVGAGTLFVKNSALAGSGGAVAVVDETLLVVQSADFHHNVAALHGGSIACDGCSAVYIGAEHVAVSGTEQAAPTSWVSMLSTPTHFTAADALRVSNNVESRQRGQVVMTSNSAAGHGGAVYVAYPTDAPGLVMAGAHIEGSYSGASGGVVHATGATAVVADTHAQRCVAGTGGGVVALGQLSTADIVNTSVNTAMARRGGVAWVEAGSTLRLSQLRVNGSLGYAGGFLFSTTADDKHVVCRNCSLANVTARAYGDTNATVTARLVLRSPVCEELAGPSHRTALCAYASWPMGESNGNSGVAGDSGANVTAGASVAGDESSGTCGRVPFVTPSALITGAVLYGELVDAHGQVVADDSAPRCSARVSPLTAGASASLVWPVEYAAVRGIVRFAPFAIDGTPGSLVRVIVECKLDGAADTAGGLVTASTCVRLMEIAAQWWGTQPAATLPSNPLSPTWIRPAPVVALLARAAAGSGDANAEWQVMTSPQEHLHTCEVTLHHSTTHPSVVLFGSTLVAPHDGLVTFDRVAVTANAWNISVGLVVRCSLQGSVKVEAVGNVSLAPSAAGGVGTVLLLRVPSIGVAWSQAPPSIWLHNAPFLGRPVAVRVAPIVASAPITAAANAQLAVPVDAVKCSMRVLTSSADGGPPLRLISSSSSVATQRAADMPDSAWPLRVVFSSTIGVAIDGTGTAFSNLPWQLCAAQPCRGTLLVACSLYDVFPLPVVSSPTAVTAVVARWLSMPSAFVPSSTSPLTPRPQRLVVGLAATGHSGVLSTPDLFAAMHATCSVAVAPDSEVSLAGPAASVSASPVTGEADFPQVVLHGGFAQNATLFATCTLGTGEVVVTGGLAVETATWYVRRRATGLSFLEVLPGTPITVQAEVWDPLSGTIVTDPDIQCRLSVYSHTGVEQLNAVAASLVSRGHLVEFAAVVLSVPVDAEFVVAIRCVLGAVDIPGNATFRVRVKPCSLGYVPDHDGRTCIPCTPGSYNDEPGASVCTSCPPGTFAAVPGSSKCQDCGAGMRGVGGTACEVCAQGMYLARETGECVRCPSVGVKCESGLLVVLPGYWRSSSSSSSSSSGSSNSVGELSANASTATPLVDEHTEFYRCTTDACTPHADGSVSCSDHRTGVFCGLCEDGFHMNDAGECSACSESAAVRLLQHAAIATAVALVVAFVSVRAARVLRAAQLSVQRGGTTQNNGARGERAVSVMKIMLNYMQVTGNQAQTDAVWPSYLRHMFGAAGTASSLPTGASVVVCSLRWSTYSRLAVAAAAPVVAVVVVCFAFLVRFVVVRWMCRRRMANPLPAAFTASLMLLYIIHPTVVREMVRPLSCSPAVDGVRYLVADLSLACGTREHAFYSMLAVAVLVVFGLGLPAVTLLLVRRSSRASAFTAVVGAGSHRTSQLSAMLSFLTAEYRPQHAHWESVNIVRKTCLVFVTTMLAHSGALQLFAVVAVLVFFFVVLIAARPFKDALQSRLEMASQAVCVTTLYCGMMYSLGEVSTAVNTVSATLLLLLNVGLMAACVFVLVNAGCVARCRRVCGAKGRGVALKTALQPSGQPANRGATKPTKNPLRPPVNDAASPPTVNPLRQLAVGSAPSSPPTHSTNRNARETQAVSGQPPAIPAALARFNTYKQKCPPKLRQAARAHLSARGGLRKAAATPRANSQVERQGQGVRPARS